MEGASKKNEIEGTNGIETVKTIRLLEEVMTLELLLKKVSSSLSFLFTIFSHRWQRTGPCFN